MNQINEWLSDAVDILNKLNGAPSILLVAILCLMLGYILVYSRSFPNRAVPLVVIFAGAAIMPLMSDFKNSPYGLRVWLLRNIVVGAIIGALTWVLHSMLLIRIPWLKAALESNNSDLKEPEPKPETPKQTESNEKVPS